MNIDDDFKAKKNTNWILRGRFILIGFVFLLLAIGAYAIGNYGDSITNVVDITISGWMNATYLKGDGSSITGIIQPYKYVVYIDGSTYKAKNMQTGAIDFTSIGNATVINSSLNAVGNGGVFIKSGTYNINQTINIRQSSDLLCEEVTYLDANANIDVISFNDTGLAILSGCTIENTHNSMGIDKYAVKLQNGGWDIKLRELYLIDVPNGIYISQDSSPSNSPRNNVLDHLYIRINQAGVGLNIVKNVHDNFFNDIMIVGVHNGTGVKLDGSTGSYGTRAGNVFNFVTVIDVEDAWYIKSVEQQQFTNVWGDSSTGYGYYIEDADELLMTNVWSGTNNKDGIFVNGTASNPIYRIQILNSMTDLNGLYGIRMSYCDTCTIRGVSLNDVSGKFLGSNNVNPLVILGNEFQQLTGTGNDYVCVDTNGVLYRDNIGCS